MNLKNYLNKLKTKEVDIREFAFISIFGIIALLYLTFKLGYLIGLGITLILSILMIGIFFKKNIQIEVTIYKLLSIFLGLTFLLLQLYNHYFFNEVINKDKELALNEIIIQFIQATGYYYLNFFSALTIFIIYIGTSIFFGEKITKIAELKRSESIFLSIAIGLIPITFIIFILGYFYQINAYTIIATLFFLAILGIKKTIGLFKEVKPYFDQSYRFELSPFNFLFAISVITFVCALLVSAGNSFISGTDGLRAYLSIIRQIALTGGFPIFKVTNLFPFPTELLATPGYILGEISMARLLLNFLSLLFIPGFYLLGRRLMPNSGNKIWLPVISILFYPPVITIISTEFKIDVFAIFISVAFALSFQIFIQTRNLRLIPMLSLLGAFAATVKATTLFFVFPAIIYLGFLLLIKNSFKPIFGGLIWFIIPILPWILLYQFNLGITDNIGIESIKNIGFSREFEVQETIAQCNSSHIRFEENAYIPGFNREITDYLKLPIQLIKINELAFDLIDVGATIYALIIATLILITKERLLILVYSSEKSLFGIILISFIALLVLTPIFTWYAASSIALIQFLLYLKITESEPENFRRRINTTIKIIILVYSWTLIFFWAFATYKPANLKHDDIKNHIAEEHTTKALTDSLEISEYLNTDLNGSIIIASPMHFDIVTYFIDDYFTRKLFLTRITEDFTDENISQIFISNNIKFLVQAKSYLNMEDTYSCFYEYQTELNKIFEKHSNLVFENNLYKVYEIKD